MKRHLNYVDEVREEGKKARREKMERMFAATRERKGDQIKELEATKKHIKDLD